MVTVNPQQTLLIISQVYPPDPAAVGQYYAEVSEEAVRRGWRVVVYTSRRGYEDPTICYPAREFLRGVDVRRLPLSSFGKSSLAIRLIAQVFFVIQAATYGLFVRNLSAVLVSTSPPFAGVAGTLIARLRGARSLWWVMDLNPDQLVAAGKASSRSCAVRVFDWLNRRTLRWADAVVALDDEMRRRLLAKASVPEKIHVIPPWPLESPRVQNKEAETGFRDRYRLDHEFIVMYSGNHSLQNPLDTLLEAARQLQERPEMRFVFVGGGAGKKAVDDLVARGTTNVLSLPYQQREQVHDTLAAADVQVVAIGDSMIGILHPCKIYTAMSVGKPILVLGSRDSPAGQLVMARSIGWCVEHGDVAGAANTLIRVSHMPKAELIDMGRRAAEVANECFARELLLNQVCRLLLSDNAPSQESRMQSPVDSAQER